MFKLLHISVKISSGYHPESNGQTERTNQMLEQQLRCLINYQQDDWVNYLHLAEFTYNNSAHSSIGYSPFFANTGCHPRWTMNAHPNVPANPAAEDRLSRLQEIHATILHNLHDAQVTHKRLADRHRLDSSKKFRVGDHVWLLQHNIKTTRPCSKLDYQRFGPYMITGKISDVAFRLDLPPHMHLHPVFHVPLLEPYTTSSFWVVLQIPHHLLSSWKDLNLRLLPFSHLKSCEISCITWLIGQAIHLMIELENLQQILPMPPWTWSPHFIANILVNHVLVQTIRPVIPVVEEGGQCHEDTHMMPQKYLNPQPCYTRVKSLRIFQITLHSRMSQNILFYSVLHARTFWNTLQGLNKDLSVIPQPSWFNTILELTVLYSL